MIPASATAGADVRVLKVADYDRIEQQVRERMKKQLIPEAKVEMKFERRRPPLEAHADASRRSRSMRSRSTRRSARSWGPATSRKAAAPTPAFAALKTKAPVVERFGLQGFGAHSADAEYVISIRSSRACTCCRA